MNQVLEQELRTNLQNPGEIMRGSIKQIFMVFTWDLPAAEY